MKKFLSILLLVVLIVALGTLIRGVAACEGGASELAPELIFVGITLLAFLIVMKKFWFPILLLIVLTAGLVGSSWGAVVSGDDDVGLVVIAIMSGILLLVHLIVWPCVYLDGIGTIAKLKAFSEKVKEAYNWAVKSTEEMEIKAAKEPAAEKPASQKNISLGDLASLQLGDLAYLQLGKEVGKRIEEFRDKAEWYNETLESYRHWNRCWFSQGFIPDVPSELGLMDIE